MLTKINSITGLTEAEYISNRTCIRIADLLYKKRNETNKKKARKIEKIIQANNDLVFILEKFIERIKQ